MATYVSQSLKNHQKMYKHGKKCKLCGTSGTPDNPISVDHILKKEYHPREHDESNWWCLCVRCHQRKTRLENYICSGRSNLVSPEDVKKYRLEELLKIKGGTLNESNDK